MGRTAGLDHRRELRQHLRIQRIRLG